jgi:hypothetical protein
VSVLLFLVSPPAGYATTALETAKTDVNNVLSVLRDPTLKAPSAREVREEKVLTVAEPMFDEMRVKRDGGAAWPRSLSSFPSLTDLDGWA